jgi:hypothetical protein
MLLGSAMASEGKWVQSGRRALGGITALAAVACLAIAFYVRNVPAPGDISSALSHNPSVYSLSLGHMLDLTLDSFAYLRLPLYLAAVAFLIGAFANFRWSGLRAFLTTGLIMVLFFHAARLALIVFDPFLTSRPIAAAFLAQSPGELIVQGHLYPFSSVAFYTARDPLLLNGKRHNLEYGAAAPGAPSILLNDAQFAEMWTGRDTYYLVAYQEEADRLETLIGKQYFETITSSGGHVLLKNVPQPPSVAERSVVSAVALGHLTQSSSAIR